MSRSPQPIAASLRSRGRIPWSRYSPPRRRLGRLRRRPSWPRSTTSRGFAPRTRSKRSWAWCRASGARASNGASGALPRRAMPGRGICSSRQAGGSCARRTPRRKHCARGRWASRPGEASASASSRSPAGWPGFSTRYGAISGRTMQHDFDHRGRAQCNGEFRAAVKSTD